ncbi:MAG: phosphotransferase [Candidatus Adiutrix sp.]|jgi:Ser/Thr protein kinase RdoA (MazF antagonist)|nr:phosphotransferase [Candidatus Adiutrix sp.]
MATNPTDHTGLLAEAEAATRDFFDLPAASLEHLPGGRVNETFLVTAAGSRFILQRLNDFFQGDEALGLNWRLVQEAIESRVGSRKTLMPPIFPDKEGRFLASGPHLPGHWRLTGFLEGRPAPRTRPSARAAARLLGSLHCCLNTPAPLPLRPLPEGEFTNQRLTRPEDFEALTTTYRRHPHLREVRALIAAGAEAARQLPFCPNYLAVFSLHDVVTHGDPKADNFLAAPSGEEARALLDWDSVGYGHVLVDLAEMLRSWGPQPRAGDPAVAFGNLAAVVEGYAETGLELTSGELAVLPPVLRGLILNLARRYLTDALAEVYFKWDRQAYPSLYLQNRARAETLLALADYLWHREITLIHLFETAYARGRRLRGAIHDII